MYVQYNVTSWISQVKDHICARKWLDLMVEESNTMDWQVAAKHIKEKH